MTIRPAAQVRIGVVGSGYAGIRAAVSARRAGADVTLFTPTGTHEFGPRLAAVAGGRAPSGDAWAEAAELARVPVRRALVTEVDPSRPALKLADGSTETFDALVVAAGAKAAVPDIPGVREHALTLKSAADALAIRRELVAADRLVVVGGGPTGVQLAHEAAVTHPGIAVTLVEATQRLLPMMPRSLGRRARVLLERADVTVLTETAVRAVTPTGVESADGTHLDGLVVWATGFAADGSALIPAADTSGGRLVVERDLRIPGSANVFAAGDVVAHRDIFGKHLAMSAQIADRAGAVAGKNAVRAARGLPTNPATLVDLGWMVAMGRAAGVGKVGPVPLAGHASDRLVPLIHELIDLNHLLVVGGTRALLAHAPGRNRPAPAQVRRVERPHLHSVG